MAKYGTLKRNNVRSGSQASSDQYASSVKGSLIFAKAKERDDTRYCGGTIFVDEASGFINITHQVSLNIAETI